MKRITKVFSIVLMMMFIAMPVLQSCTGKGKVNAAEIPWRTMTTEVDDEEQVDAPLKKCYYNPSREIAEKQFAECRYKIVFSDTFELTNVTGKEKESLKNGATHIFRCEDLYDGIIKVKVSNVKSKKNSDGTYKITGVMTSEEIVTKYIAPKNNLYDMAEMLWGGYHASKIYLRISQKSFASARITWQIRPRAQVDWDKFFEDVYQPIPDQTTYTNEEYHYDNSTDSYPVDNVQSYEYQTITPQKINVYAYVNIHEDGRKLFIRHLYKTVQNRAPAPEDYVNYMKRNVQTNAIDVLMSQEAEEKNHINSMSNEQFVSLAYKAILSRDPDATGLEDYTRLLNIGVPKTAVIKEICESPEFRERWNRPVKTLTFDTKTCAAVLEYLAAQPGVEIIKPSSTTLRMYSDDVDKVKELNISTKSLTNLNGLSQFPNLETLTAMNNKYTNISELSKLKNVKTLNLDNCNLKTLDLTPIKSMTKLQYLHLESNGLTDRMLPFAGMPSIKKLYLKNNEIVTISSTMLSDNLIGLNLENNKIMNTSYVDGSKLKAISLTNNKNGLNSRGTKKIIPEIVKDAQNKSSMLYAKNGIVFNKCKIVGNSLVMDDGAATATVTIKGGVADGTVITLKNIDIAQ